MYQHIILKNFFLLNVIKDKNKNMPYRISLKSYNNWHQNDFDTIDVSWRIFRNKSGNWNHMHVYSVKKYWTLIFNGKFRVNLGPRFLSWFWIRTYDLQSSLFSQKLSQTDKINFSNDILLMINSSKPWRQMIFE